MIGLIKKKVYSPLQLCCGGFIMLFYSKRQIYLPFTITLREMHTIFARNILRLHAAKIGAGNVIKEKIYDVSYILTKRNMCSII